MSETLRTDTGDGHIPLKSGWNSSNPVSDIREAGPDPVTELMNVLFPYPFGKYPGKLTACALLLGISRKSFLSTAKPSGAKRLSLPLARRAGKICRDYAARLTGLAEAFEARALELEKRQAGRARGFWDIRVRDSSGIPRNAIGHGRGNGIVPKKPF